MDKSSLEKVSFDSKFGKSFISSIPLSPGVYFFWDQSHKVIYIGKAKNLRRRLSQYKNAKRLKNHEKMRLLIRKAKEISWIECKSEIEAQQNEITLIQLYKPQHNIASKFSFMYPYIGLRVENSNLELLLTTLETELTSFQVFGAFRSNRRTREAFFSLVKLLQLLYRNKYVRSSESYTHRRRFERVDLQFVSFLERFLQGKSDTFLETLTLKLVEKAVARARSEFVQKSLKKLKRFFLRETRRLDLVKMKTGFIGTFVPQDERDILFLRGKLDAI